MTGVQDRQSRLVLVSNGSAVSVAENLGRNVVGAPAIAAKASLAVVPLTGDSKAVVIDTATSKVVRPLETGIAPFGAVVNATGTIAYISNWGGRIPRNGDLTAVTGYAANADRVVVDARGIASTGTVRHFDLATGKMVREIATGLHPTSMVWDEARARLYVANGNADTVTVIDTATDQVTRTITLQPFAEKVAGIAPTALALSSDGETLYVACGGINAVMVIKTRTGATVGSIPTAWYPSGVALSPDGKHLAISTLLGVGSGFRDDPKKRYVHAVRGSIAVVDLPDTAQLASYTATVAENNHMNSAVPRQAAPAAALTPAAIPALRGAPSLIEHVVFVIKENRTYDQVLGDLGKGNGDPSLVMFGEDVTPNQHRIADQFVLLDNFFATSGNSAEGHQWVTQANETDYVMWPGYSQRSYPFDGSDPIAYASGGFLWDAAVRAGKTVKIFGEFAGTLRGPNNRAALLDEWKAGKDFTQRWNTVAPIEPLNKLLAANFPAYATSVPDVARAQIFNAEVKKWTDSGKMPNLVLLQLPSNHTNGTTPGASTPKAMVADNDLALGQVVEALTKSPFWKKMAIFVVEDDAQNGVDHVDGHRTVALVASPYARRGAIDSTFYAQQSILKTIQLILGLPNLSLFDRIAMDMRASFHNTPDFTPYTAVEPKQSLFDRNPERTALRGKAKSDAIASAKMRWDVPDAVPSDKLNQILWRHIRGENTKYPGVQRSVFSPFGIDIDDEDREEAEEAAKAAKKAAKK
jgi:YVTN family beta-propeller protein